METRGLRALAASLLVVSVGAACSSTRASPPPPDEQQATAEPPEGEIEIAGAASGAFRDRGGALVGGGSTYEVVVARNGSLSFVPYEGVRGAPLSIETSVESVRPGDLAAPRVELGPRGDVRIARGALTERLRNTRDGLEQRWELPARPTLDDDADLVLRLRVGGYAYAGETPGGHHFVDATTDLGVRYGPATWIDARGARTRLAVRREPEGLAIVAPRSLVLESSYPAIIDPIVGAEHTVDTPVIPRPSGPASLPKIVAGGSGAFLVVWRDTRPGAVGLLARIVSPSGAIVKSLMLPPGSTSGAFDAAFDPTSGTFLVAWSSPRPTAVRMTSSGTILDVSPLTLMQEEYANGIATAFDGAQFVAFAGDFGMSGGLYGVLLSTAGKVTSTVPFVLSAGVSSYAAGAACGTTSCAALWSKQNEAYVSRVSKTGTVLDPAGILLGPATSAYAVAHGAGEYVAVWRSGSALYARRVADDGTLLDAAPLSVGSLTTTASPRAGIDFDGTRFTITWARLGNVYARRLLPNGTFEDASPVTLSADPADQTQAAIAWAGTQHLDAWVQGSAIRATRVTPALVATDGAAGFPISHGANDQTAPEAAFNGSAYLVAWTDDRAGTNELYAARLSASGVSLGPPVLVAQTSRKAVASDGTDFLVVYDVAPGIEAVRVSGTTGAIVGPPISVTGQNGFDPAVTFDGQSYVVAWTAFLTDYPDIVAARVSPAGIVLDAEPIAVSTAVNEQERPTLASNGNGTLAVWVDARLEFNPGDLYGARIGQDGKVVDPDGFLVVRGARDQDEPHVAWDGKQYVVTWADARSTNFGRIHDVYATRVSAAGVPSSTSGLLVAQTPADVEPKAIGMADGETALVAWNAIADGRSQVFGRWMSTASSDLLDPAPLPLFDGGNDGIALAPAAAGKVAVFYGRFREDDLALRLFVRFVESGATVGGTCTAASECRNRSCHDGRCCDVACDGPCKRCGADGRCVAVVSADDDACDGARTCDAAGACKKKNGETCTSTAECASGFCADGFCCDKACDGACDACNTTPGTCSVLASGARGSPSCSPHTCNGVEATCPSRCTRDEECAEGFGCDRPTGACVDGPVCPDLETVRAPNGVRTDCRPYSCRGGACLATCEGVGDCAFPFACDEAGRCVSPGQPASEGGGCALSRPANRDHARGALFAAVTMLASVVARRRRRVAP